MAYAVFLCGPAGTGKSTLGKALVRLLLADGRPACLLDKDTLTDGLSQAFMSALTGDGADRDSPTYKAQVRDLEYAAVLDTARENLELGVSCVMPAPWSRELQSGWLASAAALGFPPDTQLMVVWLTLDEDSRRTRIEHRGHLRDAYKLEHWAQVGVAGDTPTLPGVIQLNAGRPVTELAGALRYHLLAAA
ncbi:AAA family ATPase [Burkholderia ubonensis]|uniref:AAA family ATPase n=1 Tax=Burkholderia ubonensis TaxID=101571 RepID=UPI0007C867C9|nr:ATP-binding protein [Burkholderia ubonensis]